jgi:hypothetical protein
MKFMLPIDVDVRARDGRDTVDDYVADQQKVRAQHTANSATWWHIGKLLRQRDRHPHHDGTCMSCIALDVG